MGTKRVPIDQLTMIQRERMLDLAQALHFKSTAVELIPIISVDRSEGLPLSFAQQRLWFLAQLEGGNQAYHIPFGLRLAGHLDRMALRRALDRLVARHEALRTTFALLEDEPVQQIASEHESQFTLVEHDLRSHGEAADELDRLIAEEAVAAFDFEHGPLIRGRLICLGEADHVLLITMHHIVSDGWSMGILSNELSVLYAAFLHDQPDPLPAMKLQYADYAVWQRRWLAGEMLQQQTEYWKTALTGAPALLELPADHPRPAQQSHSGGFIELKLDKELTAALKALSKRHGTTLFMTMLTSWAILLARLSGQQDVVVGTPTANRGRAEIEGLIGFFVNTLALRLDLSGSPTVAEMLVRVKAQSIAAQQHQDIPFEQVVEMLRPVRSLSHSPLFQVMFAWQNNEESTFSFPGLKRNPLQLSSHRTAKFDLTLFLGEAGDLLTGGIEYATALFERSTIERFLACFRTLLQAMVADDATAVDRLCLLPASERHQLLYEWNDTKTSFPEDKCVHQMFEEQVERTPDAVAVVFEDASLSYTELNGRANQLAHHLREVGVVPDARVAICIERGFEMIIALLAVLKAGGAYVPLDPAYPSERLRFMLEDSAPIALLTQRHLMEDLFSDLGDRLPILPLDNAHASWKDLPTTDPDPVSIGLTPQHLAYVIYTSGSTGTPKGVLVVHRGLTNLVIAQIAGFSVGPKSRILQFAPFSFDASTSEIFMAFCQGASLYLSPHTDVLAGRVLTQALDRNAITHATLPPAVLAALSEETDLPSVQTLIVAGETLNHANRWSRGRHLINAYGPTEVTVCATTYNCHPEENGNPPIGRPIANTQVYILDPYGEPVPVGVTGELYIGGVGVARGYLNRPELTAERFLKDPFAAEADARMYRTGDLGRWMADGNIEFLGRNDFQVKIRGFRIELGEIEARLSAFPGVHGTAVIVREDTPEDKRLTAYYTVAEEDGATIGAEELRSYLSAKLPEYMVPAAYVRLDALPLTSNGKLDRQALPAPEQDAYVRRGYEPPQGETETRLAAIWSNLLKIDQIGRYDNFFELGGHSLLAIRLIEHMRRGGLQTDVRTLFTTPVLTELAASLHPLRYSIAVPANRILDDCEALVPEMLPLIELTQQEIDRIVSEVAGGARNIQDIYPLAPLQDGILFHHLMSGNGDPYLLINQIRFDTRSRMDAWASALQSVIDRHDILRTSVLWEDLSRPVQVVWRKAALFIEEIEFDPAAGDVARQLYARFDPRHFRINLRQAPLLRLYVTYDQKNDCWLMVQLLHHFIGDHTTLELMHAEIQAHLLSQQHQLPAPMPFRNFIAQAQLGISAAEHEAFFKTMLSDIDEPTAPFGLFDVQGDGTEIKEAWLQLDADLAQNLRTHARGLGVSAASLCHLAWAQVLAKVSGRENVVFGTVLFGRTMGGEAADRVLGMFINTLPMCISIGEDSVEAAIRRVHVLLADLLHHEHASLALAQRCSKVLAPAPLFSALLNYRHSPELPQLQSADTRKAWEGMTWLGGEERTNYPFTLSVDDLGQGFRLDAQTSTSINPMRVCEYMRTALESLVAALSTDATVAIRTLDVLPASERHQLLYEWNDTKTSFPEDKCVHQMFEEQVERTPDAVAVVFEDASLSYTELNGRANQLAHHLREVGVVPDARVAICIERGFEMIIALLAVLKAGGAYVPLDPAYPSERLRFMLEDSAPIALLTQRHLMEDLFSDLGDRLPILPLDNAHASWKDLPTTNPDPVSIGLTPQHLAYVIYTSGSTGTPKGVLVVHRGLTNLVIAQIAGFSVGPKSRILQFAPFSFDASTSEIFMAFCQGASLYLSPHTDVLAGRVLTQALDRNAITHATLPPAVLAALSEETDLPSVQTLIVAGETLNHANRWSRGRHLINAYGPTEVTVCATTYNCHPEENGNPPIGRPIANTQVYILDPYGEPVPVGVTGELYIGGVGVARGYLNRPELTAERFLKDPFAAEADARMYRTGDLGRWMADGNIEFLGRNDFQVKIRGFRIELGEIEARLSAIPGVHGTAVIVREDTPEDKRLTAYYTVAEEDGATIGAEELRSYLSAKLPEYMVPAAYVRLDALPLTSNGKLDRQALPAPEQDAYVRRGYEPPQGETETRLAAIWSNLLQIDQIGRYDNFFELGGHSLLAVRVISQLRQVFNVEVALPSLFTHPVLENLAQHLQSATRATLPDIIPVSDRSEGLPLSFAQQRLWFLAQLEGGNQAYHIPFGLRLAGHLDRMALRRALDRLVARHEALRTTFALLEDEPVQQIASEHESQFTLVEHDLRSHGEAADELDRLIAEEAVAAFDFEHGPLIRGRLICLGEADHVLLITMHHIVSDGWSMGILSNELSVLYAAFLHDQPDPLPAMKLQYADYAVWQRRWLAGEMLQQQTEYWKTALTGAPALLELPADHPRPAQQSHSGGSVELKLDKELTAALKALSKRHGTTLFMTMLTSWAILLARLSGQQDVVVGTPTANRGRAEIEGLIGFFVNTLALHLDLSGSPTVAEMLARVKAQSIAAQQHQDIPFEQVVEMLRPVRSLSHSPLFQVTFAWQNNEQSTFSFPGLERKPLQLSSHRVAKFDLTLSLGEAGDILTGGIEYATALFERSTIERFLACFRTLLQAMVADDATAVDRLCLLPASERHQLLYEWNDTKTSVPEDKCVHQMFEEQVERTPDAVAVVFEDASLSYTELNGRANQLAHHLREVGVVPDARVAICVERGFEMIIAVLAVLKAGGACLLLDTNLPSTILDDNLNHDDIAVLLLQESTSHSLSSYAGKHVSFDEANQTLAAKIASNLSITTTATSLAYLIRTKYLTTTVDHRSFHQRLYCIQTMFTIDQSDSLLTLSSASSENILIELLWPLVHGASLVLAHNKANDNCPIVRTTTTANHTTIAIIQSSDVRQLFNLDQAEAADTMQHLRLIIFYCTAQTISVDATIFNNFNGTIHRFYTSPGTGLQVATELICQPEDLSREHFVGRPTGLANIYILDKNLEPTPLGVIGDIYITPHRPDKNRTTSVLRPNSHAVGAFPFEDGILRTGDIGTLHADGRLTVMTYSDTYVRIGENRIFYQDVQAAITQQAFVNECVVLARETTNHDRELIAYVAYADLWKPDSLHSQLRKIMPLNMLPAAYVPIPKIPLSRSGKVDTQRLERLVVVNAPLIEQWEATLTACDNVASAAVMIYTPQRPLERLRLPIIVPALEIKINNTTSSTLIALPDPTNQMRPPSISHGGPINVTIPRTLADIFLRAANEYPEHGINYYQLDGNQEVQPYARLAEDASRILSGLQQLGLQPADRLILMCARQQDFIAAFWACILGGYIPVPMSGDPTNRTTSTVNNLLSSFRTLGISSILISSAQSDDLRTLLDSSGISRSHLAIVDELRVNQPTVVLHRSHSEQTAIMLLTSGSTGTAKAVMHSHATLLSRSAATAQMKHLTANDVSVNWLPLDHVGGLVMYHILDIFLGAHQVHVPTALVLERPLRWLDIVARHSATSTWAPNFAFGLINHCAEEISHQSWDLSSLKIILNAGESIVARTARRFIQLLIPFGLSPTAMHPAWGMSETASAVTFAENFRLDTTSDEDPFVEVGLPSPGTSLRIMNAENQIVEEGVIGSLEVKGVSVTPGYYDKSDPTRSGFSADGWFRTGDLALLRRGALTVTGRLKDVIIVNGINYYCADIEAFVEEAQGVIRSFTAACAVRSPGGDTDQIAIFFSPRDINDWPNCLETIRNIYEILIRKVGLRPEFIVPLERNSVPKTTIGKIQRSKLQQAFQAGAFDMIVEKTGLGLSDRDLIPGWFFERTWRQRRISQACNTSELGSVVVFLDSHGLGAIVCKTLAQAGLFCIAVESGPSFRMTTRGSYQIDRNDPQDYSRLLSAIADGGISISQIIDLRTYSVSDTELNDTGDVYSSIDDKLVPLLYLIQELHHMQPTLRPTRVLVVASNSQCIGPNERIDCVKSSVLGLLKTMPIEIPWLHWGHVDLAGTNTEEEAQLVLNEIHSVERNIEIAWRNGRRWSCELSPIIFDKRTARMSPVFKRSGFYLLTGGFNGIGFHVAKHLLEMYNVNLLIIGRTKYVTSSNFSGSETTRPASSYAPLEELKRIGEVTYEAVDVCDLRGLEAAVGRSGVRWGSPLNGIIHLAGIYQERPLLEESKASFMNVLKPKVVGTVVLNQLLKDLVNPLFVSFGSVNEFFGGFAAGSYSVANRFLDSFTDYQRAHDIESFCINWSAWQLTGMSRDLKNAEQIGARGYLTISPQEGIDSMMAVLHHSCIHSLVGLDPTKRAIYRYLDDISSDIQYATAFVVPQEGTVSEPRIESRTFVDMFGTTVECEVRRLGAMPLTASGEIDRETLFRDANRKYGVSRECVLPRFELETRVANIWRDLLKIDQIYVSDNFFEVGGHSLIAVRVIARIREELKINVTVADLFSRPVLSDLSEWLVDKTFVSLQTIISVDRSEGLPLSFAQQRLWFLAQLEGGNQAYHIPFGLRLAGHLDRMALRRALDRLVARHEALRTTFALLEDEPVQQIASEHESQFTLVEHDLRSHGEAADELDRLIAEEAVAAFDFEHGPLIRGRLICLGEADHVLLITIHHIVSDGWSMGILSNELSVLYAAFLHDQPDPLPAMKLQYADYAVWQRRWLAGEMLQQQTEYWKTALTGAPALLELPADHPRPAQQSHSGGFIELKLDKELTAALKALSKRHGTTLFMTMLTSWAILLARLSGQQDVVVGTPTANRGRAEIEGLIGFFVNTLALRLDLSGSPTVAEMLARVKAQSIAAQQHQDIPFEQVVEMMRPVRSLSHSPLFQVMFDWQNNEESTFSFPGLERKPLRLSSHRVAKFDLTLFLGEAGDLLTGGIEYATALFERSTIERFLACFRTLLQAMVADDATAVDRLCLLPASERHQLLYEWNDTKTSFPEDKCVHQMFEEQVERTPDAVAVVFEDASLSYTELNGRANQLAHHLREVGVVPDARVAICIERGFEMIIALLAVLKAGGAYVPLDPAYPSERLRFMLEDSTPIALLTQRHLMEDLFSDLGDRLPILPLDNAHASWKDLPTTDPDPVSIGLTPQHLAYVIYTSGSTGIPKGVLVTHANIIRLFRSTEKWFGFDENDIWTMFHSYVFDFSVWEIWGGLLYGGRLILIPLHIARSPREFYKLLCREHVTVLNQTPSSFRQLFTFQATDGESLSLRYVILGGESLEMSTLAPWYNTKYPQSTELINMYGITETTVHVTYAPLKADMTRERDRNLIGDRIPDLSIYILDPYGEPVPVGVTGELYIGGAGVARGYLNRPELTAERFLKDPFAAEADARMYRTGDLGRWMADGNIEFLGRNDFQVKIRGFRIELGEIEARLSAFPGVHGTAVIVREDTPEDKRLTAYYTVAEEDGATIGAEELRSYLSAKLPEYMVPAAYVRLDALPLTSNGKLDRQALPAPEQDAYVRRGYEPPQGETETRLAAIWSNLLQIDQIGRYDNFFELGGHSLLAVRVISQLRQVFNVEVALPSLFTHPVLENLAQHLQSATRATLPDIIPVSDRSEGLPLSFAQQRLWFLAQLEGGNQAYHIPFGLRLAGDLDRMALRRALDRLVARHEALRTTFALLEDEPVQQIASEHESQFTLVEHDLRSHGEAADELDRLIAEEAVAAFDFEHGPLIRGRLICLGEADHVLLITMHHIVSDGWSMGILSNELSVLYAAFLHDQPDPLPAMKLQYADYAVWQRRWLAGEMLQQQTEYWKTALTGAPALLELPADHPRPAQQSHSGGFIELKLDKELTAALKALSKRHGTTLFMTMLTSWAILLARLSGQQDVVVGTPTANRGRAEIEGLIGFFVNTLALHLDLSGSPTVAEMLARVKAQSIAAQQHQDIPFEQVVEMLRPVRSLSHSPLFQVTFAWQNNEQSTFSFPGLERKPLQLSSHRVAKFDLTLSLGEAGDILTGGIEYATALFERSTIERFLACFRTLLQAMVADDATAVDRLCLLPASERHQLLYEWNDTKTSVPEDKCVHQMFEEQVERTPDAVAVVFEDASLSYTELNGRANQLAHHLREVGVVPDARVAICIERGFEMIIALLAVLKAGGAYVPLDPAYPSERLRFMLEDSAPIALLTQRHLMEDLFSDLGDRLPILPLDNAHASWKDLPTTDPDPVSIGLTPQHLAYVIYTSGSTGTPKGVLVTHANTVSRLCGVQESLTFSQKDIMPYVSSAAFDISLLEILLPLANGGTSQVTDVRHIRGMNYLVEQTQAATIFNAATSLMDAWLQTASATSHETLYPDLRILLVGGEPVPQRLLRQLSIQFPKAQVIETYGPTEATLYCTSCLAEPNISSRGLPPIGRPIANTQVYILDPYGEPVPVGVTGELYIGGVGVARGYLNRPELTAEKFLKDPFAAEADARMYRTGDLGRWMADGNIEFLGRNDFQVKIRGFRIELGEIEARLSAFPGVHGTAVIVREDTPEDKRLTAYYTVAEEDGATIGAEELRSYLSAKLPEYMVPAAYVRLDALPLTSNGKLDRQALPAPTLRAKITDRLWTLEETLLGELFAEVLGTQDINLEDDFFEIGGHSLLAIRLVKDIHFQLGHLISIRTLFETPNIIGLAARLKDSSAATPFEPILPLRSSGSLPPIFFVHPGSGLSWCYAGLLKYIDKQRPVYGLQAMNYTSVGSQSSSIEEIAAQYLTEIRQIQPHGPYYLAGWSIGGLISYSIATTLQSQGEEVAMLSILDAVPYVPDKVNKPSEAAFDSGIRDPEPSLFDEEINELSKHGEPSLSQLYAHLGQNGRLPPNFEESHLAAYMANFNSSPALGKDFAPGIYNGDVTIFLAVSETEDARKDLWKTWVPYVKGRILVHQVQSEHSAMASPKALSYIGPTMALELDNIAASERNALTSRSRDDVLMPRMP